MNNKLLIPLAFLGFSLLFSCQKEKITGSGKVESNSDFTQPFNGVISELDCDLMIYPPLKNKKGGYTPDSLYTIIILAQHNVFKAIEWPRINGNIVLRLQENKHLMPGYHRIAIKIYAPDISYLQLNAPGSVNFNFSDTVKRSYLDCTNTGTGIINLHHIKYRYMNINQTGSGYILADSTGQVTQENIINSGTGRINLLDIKSDSVNATISNSGDVSVFAKYYINCTLSNSGNLFYLDSMPSFPAPIIKSNKTGTGSIIHL